MITSHRWTEIINKNQIWKSAVTGFLNLFFIIVKKINFSSINHNGHVVIIALHRLGDAVFTIPAIKHLISKYDSKLYLVCFPETLPIYKIALTGVKIITIDHKNFLLNERFANKTARSIIKELKPEIIYDLNGVMTSVSLIIFSRANEIYGLCRSQFRKLYSRCVSVRSTPHIMDIYFDAVNIFKQTKIEKSDYEYPVKINKNGSVIIHPLAGWRAKQWNMIKFIKLASMLKRKFGVSMVFPKSVLENDVRLEILNNKIDIIETETIEDLIDTIKGAFIFVGNDSGSTYIANLLGIPTFTIYGPTNPSFHLPFGKWHEYIQLELSCTPRFNEKLCFTNGGRRGCQSFECMNLLSVNSVYEKLNPFIDKISNGFANN